MMNNKFKEKISPFLQKKLQGLEQEFGVDSIQYQGLSKQYIKSDLEDVDTNEKNLKHYEATIEGVTKTSIPGVERLYRKTLVIEPTLVCSSYCRYCLRSNYKRHTLSKDQLLNVAKYCATESNVVNLNEVLITGGDPLMIPSRLGYIIESIIEHAPNIKIFRIATRLITQSPDKIDESVFSIFKRHTGVRFEIATQINHPVEFFPESISVIKKFHQLGVRIYSQNVILRGVNDNINILETLYDNMRINNIDPHYLFHCIPMKGIAHLRTSIDDDIELIGNLITGGRISGRAKPCYAAMTEIGKIIFSEGSVLARKDDYILLQSHYQIKDRLTWNPDWKLPYNAEVGDDGFLRVWYLDGVRK